VSESWDWSLYCHLAGGYRAPRICSGGLRQFLQSELGANEILIMNENNPVTLTVPDKQVYGSGKGTPQGGDIAYTVHTETADLGGSFRVRVQVTWPNNGVGISESVIVTRQKAFIQ